KRSYGKHDSRACESWGLALKRRQARARVSHRGFPREINWIEQDQLYPSDPSQGLKVPNSGGQAASPSHLLHASVLALAKDPSLVTLVPGLLGGADQNCAKAGLPPPNQPNLVICEEVRENGAFEDYIAGNNFWNRAGQQQAALSRDTIQFPPP